MTIAQRFGSSSCGQTHATVRPPPPLRIDTTRIGGTHIVAAHGDVDLNSIGPLARVLEAMPADDPVEVDLGGVGFIDSAGLGLLLRHRKRLVDAGGSLHVRNPSPAVQRVLNITGLDDLLH